MNLKFKLATHGSFSKQDKSYVWLTRQILTECLLPKLTLMNWIANLRDPFSKGTNYFVGKLMQFNFNILILLQMRHCKMNITKKNSKINIRETTRYPKRISTISKLS